MVTHQRTCTFSTDNQNEGIKKSSLEITPVIIDSQQTPLPPPGPQVGGPPPEKKLKIVLNGEDLKDFVKAKDNEMKGIEDQDWRQLFWKLVLQSFWSI